MIEDGRKKVGQSLKTQVCIVGTGAAGITLAWFLLKRGIEVVLLDSGRDFDNQPARKYEDKELLYNGKAVGLFTNNEPQFLIRPTYRYPPSPSERELTYGGTTTHWGGQSRPLDPVDFEGHSCYAPWPITREDLDPFYAQAAKFCLLHTDDFGTKYWNGVLDAAIPTLDGFDVEMYQFIGEDYLQFQTKQVDGKTIGESSATVIRNATLLNIEHQGGSVAKLRIGVIGDTPPPPPPPAQPLPPPSAGEFTIEADAYVLAAGAVANARLLLLSDAANSSDNVGRYFMCHPLIANYIDGRGDPVRISGSYLSGSEKRLLDGQLPNYQQWKDGNGVSVEGRFIPSAKAAKDRGIGRCWFWSGGGTYYFEQAPNRNSRVTLSPTETDKVFKQPLTHIDWQFSEPDQRTYEQTTELFGESVAKKGTGATVEFDTWDQIKSRAVVNGHHLGTARMSSLPKDGVVDKNLRTWDLDNLYVAGSAVWPSAGISNPTFTIITLSIRLADHLSGNVFGRRPAAKD